MTDHKEKQLLQARQEVIDLALGEKPIAEVDLVFAEDFMGFGTTIEEKTYGINEVKQLIEHQRKQGAEYGGVKYTTKTIWRNDLTDDLSLIVDEIILEFQKDVADPILLRLTFVFQFINENWILKHWHASVGVETEEGDTWHLEKWKLEKQKLQEKIDEKTAELKKSLEELKATQAQLIHSEKMASLGELTAGIAHEIQNPLNFVNNFSEVSSELINEIVDEMANGDIEEVKAILADIKENLEKINHHGKRADGIVKGMLQHSRTNSGEKELTDINQLAEEYFNLAYHGLRAKDKSFNATLKTEFDPNLGKINVVPQEIGRVLLNLINNAFYACTERSLKDPASKSGRLSGFENLTGITKYKPTVKLKTARRNGAVTITVEDNGNGIPKEVMNKIFQPFFTTKPTGQGTGLGLSMSYDIVKAHNGNLKVESESGRGSIFTIELPMDKET